ncbi:MAG: major facilitator superfamily domain-containing protein [Monoraphidium minutum]|nr:MAG: major facilitator superfamily domain-containing protein [Monoraphidium minutum]
MEGSKTTEDDAEIQPALRRVSLVILPLVMAACVMMALDRGSLSFAAADLSADLGLDATHYGIASGLFYLTYGVCQVPSTAAALRVGVRWWYGGIIVGWGVVAACTSLVNSTGQLYAMRLLLGALEAGAAPCAWHVLSAFYPPPRVVKPYAAVIICGSLASAVAGPLAGALLSMDGATGIPGWRWLFLVEGLPTILVGLAVWALMASQPLSAWWLTPTQREALHRAVHGEEAAGAARGRPGLRQSWSMLLDALRRPLLWAFIAVGLLWVVAAFTLTSWLPLMVANLLSGTALASASVSAGAGRGSVHAALLSAVPYAAAMLATIAVAAHADWRGERTAHVGVPYVLGAAALACFGPAARASTAAGFAVLTLAMAALYGGQSTMCARVAALTPPAQAGVTLAVFNSVTASIGGIAGPAVVGAILTALGSFEQAAVAMAACAGAAGAIMLAVFAWERRQAARPGGLPYEKEGQQGAEVVLAIAVEGAAVPRKACAEP